MDHVVTTASKVKNELVIFFSIHYLTVNVLQKQTFVLHRK